MASGEEHRELSEHTFSQDSAGNWENWESEMFSGPSKSVQQHDVRTKRSRDARLHLGVDSAKSHDFTAIAVVDATTRELVHLDRFNKIDFTFQRGRLLDLRAVSARQ